MPTPPFTLTRDAFGHLALALPDGQQFANITPVRAFPITAAQQGLALIDDESHEVVWIDRLQDLSPQNRQLIEDELASREFTPAITQIQAVSGYTTPSTWTVATDRGATRLVLKGEEDIRRLDERALMIHSGSGVQFIIRDVHALDKKSRKILDRFL